MIIKTQAEISDIQDVITRGNNFQITPILLKIDNELHQVEAVGLDHAICNGFNVGDIVQCEIVWKSVQSKTDSNKYWNNINLVKVNSINNQMSITPEQASIEAQSYKQDLSKDDLPF